MNHTHRIAAILALGWPMVALAQNATHLIPQCGYLNGPSCGVVDYEYWNSGIAKACDFGLVNSSSVCVMGESRESMPLDQSWVVWALNNQQRYSIGVDLQMDQIPTLGTHNSYSSYRQGFASDMSTDQVLSITDQLQWGMRIIRLDPAWYYGNWHVCHGDATDCQTPAISSNRLFAYAVEELADWLNAHPSEVIYLIINGHDGDDTSDWESMLKHYIGQAKFFTPADYTSHKGWPTMRYMLANQKQIIMMSFHQIGDLGFSYNGIKYGVHTSDTGFAQCKSQPPSCTTTDCEVDIRQRQPVDALGNQLPIFVEGGEDRTGSVATSGWGLMDESQVQTAVQCGYSMVELDFANFLPLAYPDFVEERADTRREAAIWSWASGDYGTVGPASMRFLDGRWVSQPTGTRLPYACETDLSDTATQPEGVHRYRTWNVTTQSGPWTNGQAACTAEFPGSAFSFPRNGYENANLQQLVASKGATSGAWLNYSSMGGSGLIVTANPVTVVQNGSSAGTLTFDVSTSIPVPAATGVVLSVTINLGAGTQTLENTINTQSTLRSFDLPSSWLTQPTGVYNSTATVSIRSATTGATLATTNVSFTINVMATSTTTITSVQSPVPEGTKSIFTIGVKVNGASGSGSQLGAVTVYELVTQPDGETVPVTIAGPLDPLVAQSVSVLLPPGSHQIGAKFVSFNPLLQSSSSSMITQGVVGYINPSPNSLSFTMNQGGTLPPPQSFSGQSAVQPPLISALSWASPIQTSGQGTNFTTQIALTPAAQQLQPGIYTGVITAGDFAHVTAPVAVNLTVRAPIALSTTNVTAVTSGAVYTTEVDLTQGGATPSLNLQLPNGGQPSWLVVDTMPQPSNPSQIALLVSFNPSGYAPGTYQANVGVTSPIGSNTVTLNCTMQVVPLVTIDANVPGITATIDGAPYRLPQTFTWSPHTNHTIATPTVQSGAMLQRRFVTWSSGSAASQTIVSPTRSSDTSAWHASYNTFWQVQSSVAPSSGGSIQLNPVSSDGFYADGSQLTVTANPSTGYSFSMFTGDVKGAVNPQTLTMNRGYDFGAVFVQSPEPVTIASVPAGLSVNIDGAAYQTPAAFQWMQGSTHSVTFAQTITGASGVQYQFLNWADASTQLSRNITVSANSATYTASYQTQYYLTANPSPASGGSVTGAGWWNAGASATVKATAAAGYQLSNFTGDASGTNNPLSVTMDRAKTVAANFGTSGAPLIYAAAGGPNSDSNGNRLVPLVLQNAGQGAALGAEIVSISNITAISGSGTVTTVNCPPAAGVPAACPWTAGNLSPGGSATVNVAFAWPSTVTRIRMTVNFSANNGSYTGSTVLNVFR